MSSVLSDTDFDALRWHDNHIYGLEFHPGDPELGDWSSDLRLDIDYIVEWVCDAETATFELAPATLVFHGVTDLQIGIEWTPSGFTVAPYLPSIDRIERRPVVDQKIYLDRPYCAWTILLNAPPGGSIRFGAVGFTQTLRVDAVACDQQFLGRARRDDRGCGAGPTTKEERR